MRFKVGDQIVVNGIACEITAAYNSFGENHYTLQDIYKNVMTGIPESHLGSGDKYEAINSGLLVESDVVPIPDETSFMKIAKEVAEIVAEKNKAYGNSHKTVADFFKLLYPSGIKPEQYQDALTLARIFDKFSRIASGNEAFQQEDARRDIVGYALLLAKR